MMTKDGRRTTKDLPVSSLVVRLSSVNKNRALSSEGRGARSRCHPGLPKPHGPGLNGLRRPSLVTGGAGLGLPPARPANASMRSHRLGSAPQLRSVLPRGRRRHCSDCRSLGCAVSLVLSPSTLLADVRMWRGGYHGPCDVSRRIFGRFKCHRPAIRHLLDAELRAWPIANTYA